MNYIQKRSKMYLRITAFLATFLLTSLGAVAFGDGSSPKSTVDEQTAQIVGSLSDEEKIGQMMMIGMTGTTVNPDISSMLSEYHMGGIILFDRNMETKEQVRALTTGLQQQAVQHEQVPLLIGVDEEGGPVARMRQNLTAPPAAAMLGRQGDSTQAKVWARRTAIELEELGFNVNFAPVADINGTNQRSYGGSPGIVTDFVRQAAAGYSQAGLLFTLKHFPGIGKGTVDSHVDESKISASLSTLAAEDFVPFQQMIHELNPEDYLIMVSHLTYPAIDPDRPASLSAKVVNGVLRQQLGFQGVIITDDLEMGAVSKHYSFDDLGVKAVQAGADVVLVCHEYKHEIAVYNGLLKALQNGEIDRRQVDDSVKRIVKMKLLHCKSKTENNK